MKAELYFVTRYDWKTKKASFADCKDEKACRELSGNLEPEENVYRCSINLTSIPKEGEAVCSAKEHFNENDKIDWDKITAYDAIIRINSGRVFPITPNDDGISLISIFDTWNEKDSKVQSETVKFGNRKFKITVEEIE